MIELEVERETDDWVPLPVIRRGAAYVGNWSYQIVRQGSRPQSGGWTSAVVQNSEKGFNVEALARGTYWVHVRIDGLAGYAPTFLAAILYVR